MKKTSGPVIVSVLLVLFVLPGCARPPAQSDTVTVEIRLAETKPAPGLTEVSLSEAGDAFYIHDEVILTNVDIASSRVTRWEGAPVVEVILTQEGKEKFAAFTKANVGRRAAILVNGRLTAAPVVKAPILEGKAIIQGSFTEDEAREIAAGIVQKGKPTNRES